MVTPRLHCVVPEGGRVRQGRRPPDFQLDDLIPLPHYGAGGMGELSLALTPDGRIVVVKRIAQHLRTRPDFRQRFLNEAAAARRVDSRYTAAVVMSGIDERDHPYLVMEFVAGPSLHQVVDGGARFTETGARALLAGLAAAFVDIHDARLVHRDLKPGNVLLEQRGPRVIDFGISLLPQTRRITAAGHPIGSAGFIPPERLKGRRETRKGDIWCIGAVVWYAMTGQYVDPRTGLDKKRLPGSLHILADCLNPRPARRPDARKLRQRVTAGEPVDLLMHSGWLPPLALHHIHALRQWCDHTPRQPQYQAQLASVRAALAARGRQSARRGRPRLRSSLIAAACLLVVAALGWMQWARHSADGHESAPPLPPAVLPGAPPAPSTSPSPTPAATCRRDEDRRGLPYQCGVTWAGGAVPVYRSPAASPTPYASLLERTGDQWFRCHRKGPPYEHDGVTSVWWAYTQSDTAGGTWGWVPEAYLPDVRDNPQAMAVCPRR
ncbi:serine/threonine-protein kinase [Actinoplanes sp. URMC 104]|uniref:serine/threonine-protein kinase n=1 Tax=Actinoplanes sp. URMC 104 TaxID=3423409 RepID=UPI003F1C1B13